MNVEIREILNICPRIPSQEFDEPPSEEEALSFIRKLGHSGEIKYITDGMYYKKNLDFVALIWEDLAYQIDNIDSKKQDKMFYPRFTKIIIHHFLTKDKSISMRNRMFMHTARDDSLLGTMRFISRHEDNHVYGAILPEAMTNQALLDFVGYKTYYAIALGAEPPKSKKSHKKSDSAISFEESPSKKKPAKANKDVPSTKKPATKPKLTKKKAPIKTDRGKGVPDEQQRKTSGINEGTEEDNDDEDDFEDVNGDDNDDDVHDDVNDDDSDDERTKSDIDEIPDPNRYSEEREQKEEDVDVRVHTPDDSELTDEEKIDDKDKMDEEENDDTSFLHTVPIMVIPEVMSTFTTTIPPPPLFFNPLQQQATPTPTPTTSEETTSFLALLDFSFVFKFNDRVTKLETDLSKMKQVDQYAQAISSIPTIVDRYINNKIGEAINKAIQSHNAECREEAQAEKQEHIDLVDTSVRTIIREEVKTQLPQILPKAVSNFATC
ncbi:hypothetical protein Tco_1293596 [Tanacetum coccineum]